MRHQNCPALSSNLKAVSLIPRTPQSHSRWKTFVLKVVVTFTSNGTDPWSADSRTVSGYDKSGSVQRSQQVTIKNLTLLWNHGLSQSWWWGPAALCILNERLVFRMDDKLISKIMFEQGKNKNSFRASPLKHGDVIDPSVKSWCLQLLPNNCNKWHQQSSVLSD